MFIIQFPHFQLSTRRNLRGKFSFSSCVRKTFPFVCARERKSFCPLNVFVSMKICSAVFFIFSLGKNVHDIRAKLIKGKTNFARLVMRDWERKILKCHVTEFPENFRHQKSSLSLSLEFSEFNERKIHWHVTQEKN